MVPGGDRPADAEHKAGKQISLAQFGKLICRKVLVGDPQFAPRFGLVEIIHQPRPGQGRPIAIEFAAKLRKAVAFSHADPKDAHAEV